MKREVSRRTFMTQFVTQQLPHGRPTVRLMCFLLDLNRHCHESFLSKKLIPFVRKLQMTVPFERNKAMTGVYEY